MNEFEDRVTRAVAAVVPSAVGVSCRGTRGDVVIVEVAGNPMRVAWVGEGWPKQVREAVVAGGIDLVAGRHLTPGAREAASAAGVGWVDETGAAEIVRDGLVVSRSGTPPTRPPPPPRWNDGVLAVAEALLGGSPATLAATVEATGLSTGTCARALRTLADLGLLAADAPRGPKAGRRVADPQALLYAYRDAALARREKLPVLGAHALWSDPLQGVIDMGAAWDAAGMAWAATGAVAALVVAPYLTTVSIAEVYVDAHSPAELARAATIAGATPVDRGARLVLRPFPTATSRRVTRHDGLAVVPLARLYADLSGVAARGGEAAEHLREVTGLGTGS